MKTAPSLLIYTLLTFSSSSMCYEYKLRHVSIFFRHGDRAPDVLGNENFPKDPYVNLSFYPAGPAGLTNIGKRREYELGKFIRERYDEFLGRIYQPTEVKARSMDSSRMIMSINLVMAGLYPPEPEQSWLESLNWQPVVISLPNSKDETLSPLCSLFLEEVAKVENSSEFQEELKPLQALFPVLSELTGREMKNTTDMYLLYHALMAESSMGLELPAWTRDYFPDGALLDASLLSYRMCNSNDKLKRLNSGKHLKAIVDSMVSFVKGTSRKKLDLYSANEVSVASLLVTLGIDVTNVPAYSSAVFFELLEDSGDFFVRVFYYLGIPPVIEEKILPGCQSPCPLQKFIENIENTFPIEGEPRCS